MSFALAALTFAVFSPALRNGFVALDDNVYVTGNAHVQHGLQGSNLRWALTTFDASNWHPLTWISHAADWQVWGARSAGHHLTSVLLHALNAGLLLGLLLRLTGKKVPSVIVAALFALHPLRVESVAWVSERKDVLSALLALFALHLYVSYVRNPSGVRYCGTLGCFALGLTAKPMLVTLPLLMLLLDLWPMARRPDQGWPRLLLEKLPFVVLSAASSWVTVLAQRSAHAMAGLTTGNLGRHGDLIVRSYGRYIGKMVWPASLCALYPVRYDGRDPAWPLCLGVVAVLAAGAAILSLRRPGPLAIGWLWFMGALVPVIGVLRVGQQAIADRYTYLPSIGFFMAIVFGLWPLTRSRWATAVLASVAVLVLAILSWRTVAQIATWRDSEALYTHAIDVEPDNPPAEMGLGQVRLIQERLPEAELLFRAAITTWPFLYPAEAKLGETLAREGKLSEALPILADAHRHLPADETLEFALARVLAVTGDRANAEEHLRSLEKRFPGNPAVLRLLDKIHSGP